jgi:predicted Zn-dependent protease
MTGRFRWVTAGLVVAGAACGDIATPLRSDFYEWRLIVPAASGSGNDSLSFHWPKERLPVRIWVEDAASLPVNVPAAIAAWRRAFLYNEFDATIVSDSATADVIVRAGSAPGIQFSRTRLHSALALECAGATDLDISDDHSELQLPVRVFIDPRSEPNAPNLPACLALTTTHELGHALGIWEHSPTATDLMFADPMVDAPSDRDLATAEQIYHVPPNVEAVGP